jgi:hypothetical protein
MPVCEQEEVRKMENLNKEFEAARHKAESADKVSVRFQPCRSLKLERGFDSAPEDCLLLILFARRSLQKYIHISGSKI